MTVTDNGDGTMTAVIDGTETVKNEYNAEVEVNPAEGETIFGKKNLAKTTEDDKGHTFTFTLSAVTKNAPMPEEGKEVATVTYEAGDTGEQVVPFGKITYTLEGDYEYKITETVGEYTEDKGWTITNNDALITVTVTDNGDGTMTAVIDGTETVRNEYNAEVIVNPTDVKTKFGEKDLTKTTEDGKGHEFNFTLAAVTKDAPMPENGEAKTSYAAAETGVKTIPFGSITYKAAGVYEYTITEDTTNYTAEKGWTVTNSPATVKVTVVDNGDGTLSATVDTQKIENAYNAEVVVNPTDVKTKFGEKDLTKTTEDGKGHEFNFTLAAVTKDAPMPENGEAKTSYAAAETGVKTIPFGSITYKAAGVYEYTITEDTTNYTAEKGWTVTNSPATVKVTVVDNGDGTLSATVDTQKIENAYNAEVVVDPSDAKTLFGQKNLTNTTKDGKGHEFNFKLAAVTKDAPMPENGDAKTSYAAAETGAKAIPFGTITYKAAGVYEYTITEDTTNYTAEKGWTVTNSPATVKVTVVDNGDGTLTATADTQTIENKYEAEPVVINTEDTTAEFGEKTVIGSNFPAKDFAFKMIEVADEKGTAMEGALTADATLNFTEAGTKAIGFGEVIYDDVGTHYYKITETTEAVPGDGWKMDAEAETGKIVKVEVTDNGIGKLEAKVTNISFTNEFVGVPGIEIVKTTTSKPANGTAYVLGEEITYDLKVTNTGNLTLTDVEVNDPLTGGSWTISQLDAGVTLEVFTTSYIVKEADMLAGKVVNKATVTAKDPNGDPVEEEDEVEDPIEAGITLTVVKNWADGNRINGRPASLIVTLTGGGTTRMVTLNAANNWTASIGNLPKTDPNGNAITYTWSEPAIAGYRQTRMVTTGDTTTITNTRNNVPPTPIDEDETPLGLGIVYINVGDCLE